MRAQRKCEIMAIDKLNIFSQQTPAISGFNVIPQAPGRQEAEPTTSSSNGSLVGVNPNIKPGEKMFFAAQLGKQAGEGRTLAFA